MANRIFNTSIFVFLLFHFVGGDVITSYSCPNGWNIYDQRNTCVKSFDTPMTWQDARSFCQLKGGDLVRISDQGTNDFISGLLNGQPLGYWIGLRRGKTGDDFIWTDTSKLAGYKNWQNELPEGKNEENCVKVTSAQNRQWQVSSCNQGNRIVCEHHTSITQTTYNCPEGWLTHTLGMKCIQAVNRKMSFFMARANCQRLGGDLVTIPDEATTKFLIKALRTYHYPYVWIGLREVNGMQTWVDGTNTTNYSHWGYSSSRHKSCVQLSVGPYANWLSGNRCSEYDGSICEREVIGRTVNSFWCPAGWNFYGSIDKCVKTFHDQRTWDDARTFCQNRGGDLITITDTSFSDFVSKQISGSKAEYFWIGLTKIDNGKEFEWVDNAKLAGYTNWHPGQPNVYDEQNCVQIFTGKNNKWFDYTCDEEIDFICEQQASSRGILCPEQWTRYEKGGQCIQMVKESMTWNDARTFCRREGGDLMTIPDNSTNQFVIQDLKKRDHKHHWIGLSYSNQYGQFRWVDNNSMVTFDYWGDGQPSHRNGKSCVEIETYKDYKWYQAGCSQKLDFICQQMDQVFEIRYPSGWKLYNEDLICVRIFHDKMTWNDSRAYCQEQGGDLVTIKTNSKNDFVIELASATDHDSSLWIGLHYQYQESKFVWVDNTEISFQYWARYYPSVKDKGSPVRMTKSYHYQWKDESLEAQGIAEFMCERRVSNPFSITRTSPTTTTTTYTTTTTTTTRATTSRKSQNVSFTDGYLGMTTTPDTTDKGNTMASNVTMDAMPMDMGQPKADGHDGLSAGSKAAIAIGCICAVALATLIIAGVLRKVVTTRRLSQSNGGGDDKSILNQIWKMSSLKRADVGDSS